jgi:hypothetical protein
VSVASCVSTLCRVYFWVLRPRARARARERERERENQWCSMIRLCPVDERVRVCQDVWCGAVRMNHRVPKSNDNAHRSYLV